MATKTKSSALFPAVDLGEAQERAAKLFRSARKRVEKALPEVSRKRLSHLQTRVERATKDLTKDLDRARIRAVKEARARVEGFLDGVEKTALGAVKPIVSRLDVASKTDVERLRRRVNDLEKRLSKRRHSVAA